MTTKAQKHKELIFDFLNDLMIKDKYGNYQDTTGTIKIKCKKTALRKEHKINGRWVKIWSAYYKNIDVKIGATSLIVRKRM